MRKKVGIPRGLFYYQYYPFWERFLEELGAEVIISDKTNKKILDEGVKICIDGACLPVKIFHGHVANLKDRVDYLLIPRYTSISKKEYVCPKFGGLPDMIRHTFKDLPVIIDTEINLKKYKFKLFSSAIQIGRFITDDFSSIKKGYRSALLCYNRFRYKIKDGNLSNKIFDGPIKEDAPTKESKSIKEVRLIKGNRSIKKHEFTKENRYSRINRAKIGNVPKNHLFARKGLTIDNEKNRNGLNIALIGHCYNIYDSYLNMDIIHKLNKLGANIITIDMIDESIIHKKSGLLNKKVFWYFGTKILGSIYYLLDRNDIDGIIYIMSFGCGIDSFISDLAEKKIRRSRDIPFITLTIDEHSGEAGLNTRIEAFTDMIKRRISNESNLSPHGEFVYLH